jgi:tetratricopeptide (TPR) repeat protein/transcriptional regulator with XRE-family HTH domain
MADGAGAAGPVALFCDRLRRLQQASGLTQARLVEVSGRGRTQISDILNGQITEAPDWTVVEKIVAACLAYAADEGRPVPPDLGDLQDWRRRYFDLEQDLDARGRLVGGSSAKCTAGVSSEQAGSRFRTGYLEQVKLIAPAQGLIGREAELTELATFCSGDEGPAYQWWRADAWAGKSALLSWFVLHPPPDAAVVSFFISGRFLGHDDRTGFIDVMLEQLAALLEQDLPAFLPPPVREGHLLRMLGEAAAACRAAGRRLILVVDGLDEDAGVTPAHDTHSIAALLPDAAGPGLRVIVASRPDPPIPGDVRDGHPLREPAIVRDLSRSAHAEVVRESAERGLRRILRGTPLEQDLLGLVTAAGGGLTIADLAELTGQSEYDIRSLLQSITGRVFATRINQWRLDVVYVLAHTELQATASDALGPKSLALHRHRLKAWAGIYRDSSWPAGTPEYLLRGYSEMLQASNDIPEATKCARDRVRHDRMLGMSGGDITALTEIEAAQDLALAQRPPDLAAIACLAWHRDELTVRNAWIPARLPAVWARLGQPARAEALALSATDPVRQSEALAHVAAALAAAGEFDRAEALARSIPRARQQSDALAQVAIALTAAGTFDRAEALALSATDPVRQSEALAHVAVTLAAAGEFDRAEALARSIPRARQQSDALAQVAIALAAAGTFDRAEKLAPSILQAGQQSQALAQVAIALAAGGHLDRAEKLTASITDGYWQVKALGSIAGTLAAAHPPYRAEMIAYAVTDPFWRIQAVIRVAAALAAAGEYDRAEALTRSIPDPFWYGQAVISLAEALAAAGRHDQATQAARSAEEAARLVTDSRRQAQMRAQLAEIRTAASKDDHDGPQPRPVTSEGGRERPHHPPGSAQVPTPPGQRGSGMTTPPARMAKQAEALTEAAENLAIAGQHDRAARAANRAEAIVRSTTDPARRAHALSEVAETLAATGQYDRAARTAVCAVMAARSVPDRTQRAQALTRLAELLTKSGRYDYAGELIQAIPDAGYREQAAARIARALADAGQPGKADALLRSAAIGDAQAYMKRRIAQLVGAAANNDEDDPYELAGFVDPEWRAKARSRAAEILVESGALDQAIDRAGTTPRRNAGTIIKAAIVLAEAGKYDRARELAQATGDLEWRGAILAKLSEALAVAGHYDKAEATAMRIGNPPWRARACAHVSEMLAAEGLLDRAESLARSIGARPWRTEALSHVAEALAAAALPDRAESLAGLVPERTRRARVLGYVAEALGKSGKRDRAYQVARRIRDLFPASAESDQHAQVRAQLAVALEAAGRHHQAAEIALSITGPAQQSEALARMTRILSARGEIPAAKRLLATAWTTGTWTTPLAAAALLAPEAIADLADDIREATDHSPLEGMHPTHGA